MRTLAVRLDNAGDVLLAGPALRALAHTSGGAVDLLVSPSGAAAARLLPGVGDVLVTDPPWSGFRPPPVNRLAITDLIEGLAARRYQRAVIFTSFHQSPLPMALLARMAGIGYIAADCEDYPGSLLDVRHQRAEVHEVTAALQLAEAAGGALPPGDDGRLKVTVPRRICVDVPAEPYVVVHTEASVPARSLRAGHACRIVEAIASAGWRVVITGNKPGSAVEGFAGVTDLSGRTTFEQLAAVLAGSACAVAVNSGPAHLAAATGTPVVSLFAPVVPASRWAPFGVPAAVLGDQQALCRGSRARECPVPGHPCLTGIDPADVVAAIRSLAGPPASAPAGPAAQRFGGAA